MIFLNVCQKRRSHLRRYMIFLPKIGKLFKVILNKTLHYWKMFPSCGKEASIYRIWKKGYKKQPLNFTITFTEPFYWIYLFYEISQHKEFYINLLSVVIFLSACFSIVYSFILKYMVWHSNAIVWLCCHS